MGPKARAVKFYSTVSDRSEVIHLISALFSKDGGPGSGNHGHAGRPGKVGGSGPGGGGSSSASKKAFAEKARKDFFDKIKDATPQEFRHLATELMGPLGIVYVDSKKYKFGGDKLDAEKKLIEEKAEHFFKLLEENGDPSKIPEGKTSIDSYDELYRRSGPLNREERIKQLESQGFTGKEAEEMLSLLEEFTGGDWRSVDQKKLDEFVENSKIVYSGTLNRGIHVKAKEAEALVEEIKKTGVVSFGRVASWSSQYSTAEAFACRGDHDVIIPDDEVGIVFTVIKNRTSAPIAWYSKYREGEILSGSKAKYSVVSVNNTSFYTDIDMLHTKRIPGVHVYLIERGEEDDE